MLILRRILQLLIVIATITWSGAVMAKDGQTVRLNTSGVATSIQLPKVVADLNERVGLREPGFAERKRRNIRKPRGNYRKKRDYRKRKAKKRRRHPRRRAHRHGRRYHDHYRPRYRRGPDIWFEFGPYFDDYYPRYRYPRYRSRVSCNQGYWVLRHRGYYSIRAYDCSGKTYGYRASKRGRRYTIRMNAYTGGIKSRHRIR